MHEYLEAIKALTVPIGIAIILWYMWHVSHDNSTIITMWKNAILKKLHDKGHYSLEFADPRYDEIITECEKEIRHERPRLWFAYNKELEREKLLKEKAKISEELKNL